MLQFETSDLAGAVDSLTQFELDHLPFGVILLDHRGVVTFYSATESRQSGYSPAPLGRNLFDVSRCLNTDAFRGRIERAMSNGVVDLDIEWMGDFAHPDRPLRIRVQSAKHGGVWIFIHRPDAHDTAPDPLAMTADLRIVGH